MKKKIFLKKKKIILFLFLIFIFCSGINLYTEPYDMERDFEDSVYIYTVSQGDTIWTVADYFEVKNKNKFIDQVIELNNIIESRIYPGDKLCIPKDF
ncbi:MAG: LysM peptidoglycan-binding domain-containing protein [Tissierellia bacterium]|nr:LysM peptidoglycan-binding domain-containing protein [Tissierellia bacterium]